MRKDENGFTLVELMISLALLGFVCLMLIFLMQMGGKAYANSKAEVDLQTESQMVMSQMNTWIMESNYAKYDNTHHALELYTTQGKANKIIDKKVIFRKDTSLYLVEFVPDPANPTYDCDQTVDYTAAAIKKNLLCDYIDKDKDGFKVTVNKSEVTVSLDMLKTRVHYNVAANTTKMRNGYVDLKK